MGKIMLFQNSRFFFRYCLIGAVSTVIDVGGLYVLREYAHFPVVLAAALSFLLAAINGFVFNRIWTFDSRSEQKYRQFFKFLTVATVGLFVNVLLVYLLAEIMMIWYMYAKIITSGLIFSGSYLVNKKWTFVSRKET